MENEIEKIHIFDIIGKYAHFRKFYTNSSSLSYLVPPRTVIAGMIAGMFGIPSERFSSDEDKIYYKMFNSSNCFISVALKTHIRKMMQMVNYLYTKTQNNEISFSKHSQIPLEILTAQNEEDLRYRVYFGFTVSQLNDNFSDHILKLKNNKFVYPPYLGLTEFLATIDYIGEGNLNTINDPKKIHSVCMLKNIEEIYVENGFKYLSERMPTGFSEVRNPLSTEEYLIEVNGKPIKAKYKEDALFYKVEYMENNELIFENITPM